MHFSVPGVWSKRISNAEAQTRPFLVSVLGQFVCMTNLMEIRFPSYFDYFPSLKIELKHTQVLSPFLNDSTCILVKTHTMF